MKRLSVIVPVYNVEKYLEKCLLSLASQTASDIEFIIVNDGSSDSSESIAERFSEKYPERFILVKKENGGLSDARNFGIQKAVGEYIAFLDGDDRFDAAFAEKMLSRAEVTRADVIACDTFFEYPEKKVRVSSGVSADCMSKDKIKETFTKLFPAAWNKIYKKQLLTENSVFFKKGVWFEDVEFLHRLLPYIKSISFVNEPLVFYVQHEGSVTNSKDKRIFDYLSNFEGIAQFYRENGFFAEYRDELEFSFARYLLATFLKRAASLSDGEFSEAVGKAFSLMKKEFPDYRKNPYLKKNGSKGLYLRTVSEKNIGFMKKAGLLR